MEDIKNAAMSSSNENDEDNSNPVLSAAGSSERLRWRTWPCSECGQGRSPIGFLLGCYKANPELRADIPEKLAKLQVELLQNWVKTCAHTKLQEKLLPLISKGSEHAVYLDESDGTVIKTTLPGVYGDSYYIKDDRINQRNCSPLDYLIRLRIWDKLFRSAPDPIGITPDGQILSKQKYITGTKPAIECVEKFLTESGLEHVRRQFWLWKKSYADFEIWVGDAREDNFVETPAGVVPIDLRVWFGSGFIDPQR